jgi:peptidoglycan/LPS O-acetylase OafA/YrhL
MRSEDRILIRARPLQLPAQQMRKSGSDAFIPELDGLRGIAILLVMLHRVYPRAAGGTPWPIEAGWIGVDLFFVISGFLIAGILIDSRGDAQFFRNFYARRVLRIFPLFYLLVGGMLIAFPLLGHRQFLHDAGSPLWYLLQLGNVPEGLLGHNPPYWLGPVWSLAIEEQFYWTFPLLVAAVAPQRLARWLFAFAALALVARIATTIAIPDRERVQYLFTLCRLDTIAAGCLLAVLVRTPGFATVRHRLPRWLVLIASSAAVVAIATQLDRTTTFGRTAGYSVVALAFAALVLLVVLKRDTRSTSLLRWAPLRYFGKICFGLYLLHRPADTLVTGMVGKLHLAQDALVLVPIKIAVAVGLATLSWRLLETPCLRLKRYFSSKPASAKSVRITAPAVVAAG